MRSLRRTEAERRGITQGIPDAVPQLGFGLAPPRRGDEPPNPDLTKHDPAVVNVHKQREQQMQRELEEAQGRARADREKQDPGYWLEREYRAKYGEDAGRAVAWGRAMEERGRAVSMVEARRQYAELTDQLGITLSTDRASLLYRIRQAATDGFIGAGQKTIGEVIEELSRAAEKAVHLRGTLAEARALAALIGHRSGIAASGDAVKMPLPRLPRGAPDELRKSAVDALLRLRKFWSELADASLVLPDRRKGYAIQWRESRPSFAAGERVVYTRWIANDRGQLTDDGSSTIVHESGHGVEHLNARAKRQANEFIESRTRGEPSRKMSELTGNSAYKDDETTKRDEFFDPYVGRQYVNRAGERYATEATSMALEYLHRDAARLLREDPEHFWFGLGQLAGESVQR